MFDFLRNLTKSVEEKRQEALNAYLDDALTPRQRQQFEQDLAQDANLQSELDNLRFFKQQLRQLPPRRVPRNFTLDPAAFAPPQKQPLFQFYPVLQGATVLTAFFFVIVLALGMFTQTSNDATVAFAPAAESGSVAQGADTAVEDEVMEEEMMEEPAPEEMMGEAAEEVEVQATAAFNVQTETMNETLAEEPMEEEAAEESEEVVEDTVTNTYDASATAEVLATLEAFAIEEEAPSAESGEPAPSVAVGGTANVVVTVPPTPTDLPLATATVSVLPRVSETATAVPDDRALPTATPLATAVPPSDDDAQMTTAATNDGQLEGGERTVASSPPPQPPLDNTLRTIQIVLGMLLLLFGLTTFLVRRRM